MGRPANDFLPLKPVDLHLLIALADGDQHGYGLVQAIEQATGGLVRLDPGNLYRVIKRLLDTALVADAPRRAPSTPGEERRRYYRITPLGRRVLVAELRRLESLVADPAVRAIARGLAT